KAARRVPPAVQRGLYSQADGGRRQLPRRTETDEALRLLDLSTRQHGVALPSAVIAGRRFVEVRNVRWPRDAQGDGLSLSVARRQVKVAAEARRAGGARVARAAAEPAIRRPSFRRTEVRGVMEEAAGGPGRRRGPPQHGNHTAGIVAQL